MKPFILIVLGLVVSILLLIDGVGAPTPPMPPWSQWGRKLGHRGVSDTFVPESLANSHGTSLFLPTLARTNALAETDADCDAVYGKSVPHSG
jgi:hypothetical protein